MPKSKVSVIIPTYNSMAFIEDTLASVMNQTYQSFEIIVVDDASGDGTPAYLDNAAKSNSKLHVIALSQNHGVANARNVGVQAATGRWVAFLDADDQWLSNKLELQVEYLESHNARFGYGSYELMDSDGHLKGVRKIRESSLSHREMLGGNRIGLLTVILDRKVALAHPFPAMHSEDYACWLSVARTGVVAYRCTTEPVAKYRQHPNSTSANKVQAAKWTWRIYREVENMNVVEASLAFIRYAWMVVSGNR